MKVLTIGNDPRGFDFLKSIASLDCKEHTLMDWQANFGPAAIELIQEEIHYKDALCR